MRGWVLSCFLIVTFGSAASSASAPAEVRALWVVRTSITSPEDVRTLIANAKAANINTLVVQVRGRGDAYYCSRWEPRSVALEAQPVTFDPLREVLEQAHAAGIEVDAWLNTYLIANLGELPPPQPDHIYNAHPDWLAVPRRAAGDLYSVDPNDPIFRQRIVEESNRDRSQLEGIYSSPASAEVQQHVYDIFMDVVENYDVDGVHFDYVRFPNVDFDYSRAALDGFRDSLELRLSLQERRSLAEQARTRPLIYVEKYSVAWNRYRRQQVTSLVERIYQGVKQRKPSVRVSAAVFANDQEAFAHRFQDWRTWLEQGILDVLCPMAYTTDTSTWKQQIRQARDLALGREVWAGIGAWRQSPENTMSKIRVGRRMGVDGFILFSYAAVVTPSDKSPEGDYLMRLAREVFGVKGHASASGSK